MLETTQKSTNTKWINELEHTHTMEYHTSHGNGQATTIRDNMILSKRSQDTKTACF